MALQVTAKARLNACAGAPVGGRKKRAGTCVAAAPRGTRRPTYGKR